MSEIRITPAVSDADVGRSLEVYNAVHAPHRESLGGVHETERRSEDFVIFIAHLDGEVAGAAHALFAVHSLTPNGDVYVLPELRRRGIGDRLFREIRGWAVERGATELRASPKGSRSSAGPSVPSSRVGSTRLRARPGRTSRTASSSEWSRSTSG